MKDIKLGDDAEFLRSTDLGRFGSRYTRVHQLTVKFVLLIVVPPAFVTGIGPVGWNRSSEGLPGPDMHGGEAPHYLGSGGRS